MAAVEVWQQACKKFFRDRQQPWRLTVTKGGRYLASLLTSRLYLHGVDRVGAGVRTIGRPRIENQGSMYLGNAVILRSVNVPVELATLVGGTLVIGDEVSINYGTSICAAERVEIGKRTRIGPYAMIIDTDFHDAYNRSKRPLPRPVVLEDDVWIGARAAVLRGVRIGRGSIVGTSAVVTSDIPPFSIVAGVPAKVIGQLDAARFCRENGCEL